MKFSMKKAFKFLNISLAASLLLSGNALAADLTTTNQANTTASNQAFISNILAPFSTAMQADAQAAAEKQAQEAEAQAKAAAAEAAAEKAAQEAAAKAAAEKEAAEKAAAQTAAKATVVTQSYTPTYGSSVSYSSSKKATDAIKANSTCRGTFKITFYCSCSKCCGKSNGITASGTKVKEGRTVAVSRSKIKLGSKLFIEGFGNFIAEDTGVSGNKIDVFVNSHAKAYQLGVRYATVYQLK